MAGVFLFEFMATFFFTVLGCAGLVGKNPSADQTTFGLHLGLTAVVIMHIFGFLSGALINPSVVLASMITGVLKWDKALVYIIAEFLGAFAGYYALIGMLPEESTTGGQLCLAASEKLSEGQIVGVEFLLTCLLVFGIFALLDTRNRADVVPIRNGALLAVCVLVGVLHTGTGLNSAIMVAVAQANDNNFEKIEYYLAGQYSAAIVAALLWKFLFAPKKPPTC